MCQTNILTQAMYALAKRKLQSRPVFQQQHDHWQLLCTTMTMHALSSFGTVACTLVCVYCAILKQTA
jgi:hypothetical protein